MKPRPTSTLALISFTLVAGNAQAQSTWVPTAAGTTYDWQNAANWSPSGAPSGTTIQANLNNNIAGAQTVSLNGAVTLNRLDIGDSNSTHAFTLQNGTGGSLTFGGTAPQLNKTGTLVDTISATVTLDSNLAAAVAGGLNMSGNIGGVGNITKTGTGTLTLTGTNNYSGGTAINVGTVQFGKLVSMSATGTVAVTTATLAVNLGGTGEWTTGTSGVGTLGGLISATTGSLGGQTGSTVNWSGASAIGLDTTNASGVQTYSNGIVNRGTSLGVTKLGSGTLTIGGTNTYTGATTVNGGTLNMSGTFGNTAVTVNSAGTVLFTGSKGTGDYNVYGAFLAGASAANLGTGSVVIHGGGRYSSDGTTARTINGRIVMNGDFTLGSLTNTGKLTFQTTVGSSTVGSGVRAVTVLSDAEITQSMFGAGAINKLGTAELLLSSATGQTYTGNNTASLGTFRSSATSGAAFGTGGFTIGAGIVSLTPTGSGADISLTGGLVTTTNNFNYNAGGTFSLNKGTNNSLTYTFSRNNAAAGFVRGTNGTLILSVGAIGNLGNTAAAGGERFLVTASAAPVTMVNTLVSGVVAQDRGNSNAGDFVTYDATNGFTKASYTHTNNFTGATNASRVEITSATSTGLIDAYALKVSGATVTNSGTITLGSSANPTAGIILNGGTISGGTLTTPTSSATEFVVYTSGTSSISSSINTATSQAGLSLIGPGTLDVTGSSGNSFTGALRINNSTLIYNNNNQLGGTNGNITLLGGTLQSSGTVALGGGNRTITLSAGQNQSGGTFNVTSGTTTFQNASTNSKILNGTGSLTKTGSGTLMLTGNTANTYTGGTTINAGTLQFGNLVSMPATGTVAVSGGTLAVNLGGAGEWTTGTSGVGTLGGLISATTGSLGGQTGSTVNWNGNSTVGFDTTNAATSQIYGGNIVDRGTSLGVTKLGSGTLTLAGTNTYTGATTVSAGTLFVTGALSNSAVTVQASGTIGSNGSVGTLGNGLSIAAGGNLDLTGATLGLNSSNILSLASGSLTLGALTFEDIVGWDWANAAVGTYELIDGSFTVDFGSTAYTSAGTAYDFGNGRKGYFTSGSLNAVIVAIPEPSTALLGGLGILALLRRRRN